MSEYSNQGILSLGPIQLYGIGGEIDIEEATKFYNLYKSTGIGFITKPPILYETSGPQPKEKEGVFLGNIKK